VNTGQITCAGSPIGARCGKTGIDSNITIRSQPAGNDAQAHAETRFYVRVFGLKIIWEENGSTVCAVSSM
jgi:hypothetical protein